MLDWESLNNPESHILLFLGLPLMKPPTSHWGGQGRLEHHFWTSLRAGRKRRVHSKGNRSEVNELSLYKSVGQLRFVEAPGSVLPGDVIFLLLREPREGTVAKAQMQPWPTRQGGNRGDPPSPPCPSALSFPA